MGCRPEPRLPLPDYMDTTAWSKLFCGGPISAKNRLVSSTHQSGDSSSDGSMREKIAENLDSCQRQRVRKVVEQQEIVRGCA